MQLKRILVAVDGSETSLRAAKFAAGLAAPMGAQLTLAHAIQLYPAIGSESLFFYPDFEREQEKAAQALLQKLVEKLDAPSLKVETRIPRGVPAEAISHLAKAEDFDLVVAGNRGTNPLARLLLGSVADRLVHLCERPVLIVR